MRKLPRHPQRQRAPAAAELEDRLAVGKLGMLRGLAQRLFFRFLKSGGRLLVEAGRVFAVRPEHFPGSYLRWQRKESTRTQLIVAITLTAGAQHLLLQRRD